MGTERARFETLLDSARPDPEQLAAVRAARDAVVAARQADG